MAAKGEFGDEKAHSKAKQRADFVRLGWRAPSAAHRPSRGRHLPHEFAPLGLSEPARAIRLNMYEMTVFARSITGLQTWSLPNGDPLLANFYIDSSHHGKAFVTRQDEMGAFGRQ